jgi:hypothetical protein
MAILEEANLLAERARHAKHRTHHVGTKLNEGELHEFEALAERRQQTPSELIRGLVLGEIERDKQPAPELRPSVELEEITALRLLLINVLPKLATGETMPLETYQKIEAEVLALRTLFLNLQFRQAQGPMTESEMRGLIERADGSKMQRARERLEAVQSAARAAARATDPEPEAVAETNPEEE